MAIPISTRTVTVLRPDPKGDLYDEPSGVEPTRVVEGLRAHVWIQTARYSADGGEQAAYIERFVTDPADIRTGDTLKDEDSGEEFYVETTVSKPLIQHVAGTCRTIVGQAVS